MNKPLLLVTAPISTRSGYGNHSRDICQALIESDKYDLKINPVRWGTTPMNALETDNPIHQEINKLILDNPSMERQPDLHIHITVPNEFQPLGKKNIGITAGIEHTTPPPQWVDGVNRMDLTFCTSEFTKNTFENVVYDKTDNNTKQVVGKVQVEKPLETLFEGADPNIYKETKEMSDDIKKQFSEIKEDFCFLSTGHWLAGNLGEDRKDIGMLLKVFLEGFKNRENTPALILKTSGATFSVMDREDIIKKINTIRNDIRADKLPNVYLLHGDLSDEEMNQMYNHPKVKAHVTFTHGEGFGRPLLEASFSGKPIIAPIWSGQEDFLDKSYTIELPGVKTKVPQRAFPKEFYIEGSEWYTINYGVANQILQDIFKNYEKYILRGKKQMIVNKQLFTHEKMSEKLCKIVDTMVAQVPQPVSLKLPKLQKVDKDDKPLKISLPKIKRV
tara:strand:- start:19981 stop:21315 length:1335 start_codon:yes stop_codon:yes gene_type:complete